MRTEFSTEIYRDFENRISEILLEREPVVVGIDGYCGSGKSTLAEYLRRRFACNVIHTDDFYLPFDARKEGWEKIPCANMDLERLERSVLRPARSGEPLHYKVFRAHTNTYTSVNAEAAQLTIVEGSYCLHPDLRKYYRLSAFLVCDSSCQLLRIRERNPERYEMFVERWIPLELGYEELYHASEYADCLIRTDGEKSSEHA